MHSTAVMLDHATLGKVTPVGPRALAVRMMPTPEAPRYSICMMVTNWQQYADCMASYRSHGFDSDSCEFLILDNSAGNLADAYVALNEFLQAARGDYIVLTHQDVTLIDDGRAELDHYLDELTRLDEAWAICGNAGKNEGGVRVFCLSHPFEERHVEGGPFPARVMSLDENFIVVRKLANLALSRDLSGFHHYGADLCTIADILGWRTYVIGFYLRHHSGGKFDASYEHSRDAVTRKYQQAMRPRWVHVVTEQPYYISGNGAGARRAAFVRLCGKAKRRIFRKIGLAR